MLKFIGKHYQFEQCLLVKLFNYLLSPVKRLVTSHWKYIAGSLTFVVMAIQLLYPDSWVPPHAYLGQTPIGMKSRSEIRHDLTQHQKIVSVKFNDKAVEFDPAIAGINLDVDKTLAALPSLKWYERLIPLWPYIKTIPKSTSQPVIARNNDKIASFASTLATAQYREPINASADIKDGELTVKEAIAGEEYPAETIKEALLKNDLFIGPPIKIQPRPISATLYALDFVEVKNSFAKITAQPLKISYGTTAKEIDKKTVTSWLKITQNPDANKPQLSLNPEAVEPFLKDWNKEFTVAPGITQLSLIDNVEVSRKNGASGRAINSDAVKVQITAWMQKPTTEPIALATKVLAPKVIATRTYSQSSAGLLAKLTYWLQTHPGSYQVAIRELGGQGREASYNVSQQTVMASTYKPFLAFVAYKQAESGALDLNTNLAKGKNIEQCIEVMIVNSDNDCAVALGKNIGWAKVDDIIAATGFSNVRLNNYNANGNLNGDKLVNAREQANFLAQLSGGLLINASNTDKLLGYMKRQIHRQGIPAGSQGAVVADKVGFLEGYLHDVGIVYAPNATYALVIMSQGSSWTNISNLSQAVYDFMNE